MILTFEVVDSSLVVLLWCFSLECVREFVFSVTFFEVACLSSFSEDISSKVKVPHKNDKRGYYGSGESVSVYLGGGIYLDIRGRGRCGNGAEM